MFFRYPGGKKKLYSLIQSFFQDNNITEYREPFFGGGSVGLTYMKTNNSFFNNLRDVWINDKDESVMALWKSVIKYPNELKEMIMGYEPKVDDFYDFTSDLINGIDDDLIRGFKKIVIHQISYSGLGTKSGGPLGGKDQKSKYKIDCRWSKNYICRKIDECNKIFNRYNIKYTALDFDALLENSNRSSILIYLDPPYYVKGSELYQCHFDIDDHRRLAEDIKKLKCKWILSYDHCPEILDLYSWAKIEEVPVIYTIRGSFKKKEVIIYG